MHAVTKEILKLVRASSALHAIRDRSRRAQASFFDAAESIDPEYDTEQIYFELLREIGRNIELRVIVDIIAGASAGGINGAMLALALVQAAPRRTRHVGPHVRCRHVHGACAAFARIAPSLGPVARPVRDGDR